VTDLSQNIWNYSTHAALDHESPPSPETFRDRHRRSHAGSEPPTITQSMDDTDAIEQCRELERQVAANPMNRH